MKKLSNLKGVKTLSKKEQKTVKGGRQKGYICAVFETVVCYLPTHCVLGPNGWYCA